MKRNFFTLSVFLFLLGMMIAGCNSNTSETDAIPEDAHDAIVAEMGGDSQINHILLESEASLRHYEEIAQTRNFTPEEMQELSTTAKEIGLQTQELLNDPSLTAEQSAQITELHHRWMSVVHHNLSKSGSGPMSFDASNVAGAMEKETTPSSKTP